MQSLRPKPFVPQLPQFTPSQQPQPPELSKPRKKRERYGFSYPETFMYDSDEYPDTEYGSDDEEQSTELRTQQTNPPANRSVNRNRFFSFDTSEQTSRPASRGSTATIPDQPFNGLIVVRDVGSFHLTRPQRILPCTQATREDTVCVKHIASELIDKHEEAENIQTALLSRLERMVHTEQQTPPWRPMYQSLSVPSSCTKSY
jgi:hypothetical protein